MSELIQLTFPITGMTCANCAATIERNLKKLDGVESAVVNLSAERGTVNYDRLKLGVTDIIAGVQRAGYGVASARAELTTQRSMNAEDATLVEETLAKLDGVLNAKASPSNQGVVIEYIPTMLSQVDLRRAMKSSGFDAAEEGSDAT